VWALFPLKLDGTGAKKSKNVNTIGVVLYKAQAARNQNNDNFRTTVHGRVILQLQQVGGPFNGSAQRPFKFASHIHIVHGQFSLSDLVVGIVSGTLASTVDKNTGICEANAYWVRIC